MPEIKKKLRICKCPADYPLKAVNLMLFLSIKIFLKLKFGDSPIDISFNSHHGKNQAPFFLSTLFFA